MERNNTWLRKLIGRLLMARVLYVSHLDRWRTAKLAFWVRRRGTGSGASMSDETAKMARLMRVTDAVIAELDRQGVAEVLANLGFDRTRMAQAVIRPADGDVIQFPGRLRGH